MANFKDIMALCLDVATYSAIAAALGCSRRDIAKVKTLIAKNLTKKYGKNLVLDHLSLRIEPGEFVANCCADP